MYEKYATQLNSEGSWTQIKRLGRNTNKKTKKEISKSRQGEDVTRYQKKNFKEKRIKEKS